MDEILKEMIIRDVAPIIIPLPFCGEYRSKIEIIDTDFCKSTIFYKKNEIYSYITFLSIDAEKTFMLENIFKIQESIIIYNSISKKTIEDFKYYSMRVLVKNGNQIMDYTFNTFNRESFINYLNEYSLLAAKNKLNGISDSLIDVTKNFSDTKIYKFKTKRKSLL